MCTQKCGGGTQERRKSIKFQSVGTGKPCPSAFSKLRFTQRACNTKPCCKGAKVGEWSAWSGCTVTCGPGTWTRTRKVVLPIDGCKPASTPTSSESGMCASKDCECSNCVVSAWQPWSSCTQDCGGGVKRRKRVISKAGDDCGRSCGPLTDQIACNPQSCVPPECKPGPWNDWSICSAKCGSGTVWGS